MGRTNVNGAQHVFLIGQPGEQVRRRRGGDGAGVEFRGDRAFGTLAPAAQEVQVVDNAAERVPHLMADYVDEAFLLAPVLLGLACALLLDGRGVLERLEPLLFQSLALRDVGQRRDDSRSLAAAAGAAASRRGALEQELGVHPRGVAVGREQSELGLTPVDAAAGLECLPLLVKLGAVVRVDAVAPPVGIAA